MSPPLSIECLRRIQRTLEQRVGERDPANIQSVGFAPASRQAALVSGSATLPVTVQFDVLRKRSRVRREKRIEPIEAVRLLDRSTHKYDELLLPTDVVQVDRVVASGVRIATRSNTATTSVVVRWTSIRPVPEIPVDAIDQDPRWRWGVLTVSHVFASQHAGARVERNAVCGDGPKEVGGRVVARGRVPGGPDIGLVETGLDRLWLSGFLPRIDAPVIKSAGAPDLLRWMSRGIDGTLVGDGTTIRWNWNTFYPRYRISGLGNLHNVIRYQVSQPSEQQRSAAGSAERPFGPGTSGAVLVAGGVPIGIQVAAMRPDYRIGYAQAFSASLPWLRRRLRASHFAMVAIVTA